MGLFINYDQALSRDELGLDVSQYRDAVSVSSSVSRSVDPRVGFDNVDDDEDEEVEVELTGVPFSLSNAKNVVKGPSAKNPMAENRGAVAVPQDDNDDIEQDKVISF